MNAKTFTIFGAIVAVGLVFALSRGSNDENPNPAGDSSGLIIGKNAIYIGEQAPGEGIAVAVVYLEAPGFAIIHEDNVGKPGKILGISSLLAAGETKNPSLIGLSRETKNDETLYAMLHLDDGDNTFDVAKDKPAIDSINGEPVMMIFSVGTDAPEPGAVNP